MATINNAANTPLNQKMGSTPDVSGALQGYYQTMTFEVITKTVVAGEAMETTTPVTFRGVIQPFQSRQLFLKPEGQRAWTWFTLHSDPVLSLNVDDVMIWNGKQTRVMQRKNYTLEGFVEYELVQDWTGSDPS